MLKQRSGLTRAELVEFSKVNQWIMLGTLVFDWGVIAGAIALSILYPNWFVYIACLVLIGGRQHGLGILAHEAAHYRFIKNRKVSEVVANLFLTWPIFYSVGAFRKVHLAHHNHLNTDRDPDFVHKQGKWLFPKTRWQMARMLLGDLLLFNLPLTLLQNKVFANRLKDGSLLSLKEMLPKVAYYGGIAFVLIYFGWVDEFFWYWLLPYLTWLHLIFKLRSVAEHYAIYGKEPSLTTRTVLLSYVERFLITPHHINMHVEHHTYPSVPFYKLLKLHRHLSLSPAYQTEHHFTRSFVGVIREGCEAKPEAGNS